jgi:putative ABC transport system permease protein
MIRLACRRWRHRPGLALTATAVLALGIGATTAMYSIVDAVVLKDDPWPDANRLVRIYAVAPDQRSNPGYAVRWNRGAISWASWRDLQKLPVFSDVAAWVPNEYVIGTDRPEPARTFFVSSSMAAMLGVTPALGRFFTVAEDEVDSTTVVISHRLWVRMFGADPDIVGKSTMVTYPGSTASQYARRTIVGVLPETLLFPGDSPDVFLPIGSQKYNGSFGNAFFLAIAKLAPNVSQGAAADAAEPLVRRTETRDRRTSRLVTLREERVGIGDGPLWFMLGGAALLLVVACSNVAGLLLGDARSRHHETAVRLSLGGTRWAILRQLFVEHALLATAAGVGGVVLATWLIPSLVALAPAGLVRDRTVALDPEIAAWSVAAAIVTTFLAGLIPAAAISSTMPGDVLKTGGRQATRGGRWRHRLVVSGQFGLALVLIVAAGLFVETLLRLGRQPLGFLPEGVVVAAVTRGRPAPGGGQVLSAEEREKYAELRRTDTNALSVYVAQLGWTRLQPMLDRIGALPGVTDIALATSVPFASVPEVATLRTPVTVYADGQRPEDGQPARGTTVSEAYFRVLATPILRGRAFDRQDMSPAAFSIIVSEEFERRVFGGNAVGRRVRRDNTTVMTVVGVVPDVKVRTLAEQAQADYYTLMRSSDAARFVITRVPGDAGPYVPSVRSAIEVGEPSRFVTSVAALSDLVSLSIVIERGRAMLSAMYGGVALLLAAVGLYGLAARFVAERRREIGIRVALGAGPDDVRRLVMSDAWIIVGLGLVAGAPAAFIASRLAQGMLFGVTPSAPHVLGIAVTALALVAMLSTVVPALRANRIDPAVTLREE